MNKITIIQGDTLSLNVRLKNVDLSTVDAVYFSCEELGVCKKLELVDGVYELELSCDETCNFKKTVCCYDLTIRFNGNKVKTIQYRERLEVLPKVNKVIL